MSQKRKKHIKSLVFVPEDAGIEFAGVIAYLSVQTELLLDHSRMLFTLGHMALSITRTQLPPILACTPYQILSIVIQLYWYSHVCIMNHVPSHSTSVEDTP